MLFISLEDNVKEKSLRDRLPVSFFLDGYEGKAGEKILKKWHLAGTLGTVLSSTFVGHKCPELIISSLKPLGFTGGGLGVGTDGHKCTNLPFFLPIACIL